MIIKHSKDEKDFSIDTGNKDPIMIVGLLMARMHKMYEITIEGDRVLVHKTTCNA